MPRYEGVVYDLDGTLLHLDVDWESARKEIAAKLRPRGIDTDATLWELFERAEEEGYGALVNDALATHERDGARTSERLPLADELPHEVPVGVCSLNAESACRVALEIHGLDGYVATITGRDTVGSHKPDPEPLLHTIEQLGVNPENAVFIGDTERDEKTATRAGVPFQYAYENN